MSLLARCILTVMAALANGRTCRWTLGLCAHCEAPLDRTLPRSIPSVSLFCSRLCHDWAKDVRYRRGVIADGRIDNPGIQEALRTRLAHLLAGGYPAKERHLIPAQRAEVLARNGGLCVACNERPAVEVDHIDGSSSDPANLQGLCRPCHHAKTEAHFVPLTQKDREVRDIFMALVDAPEPVMLAHAPSWDEQWRTLREQTYGWRIDINTVPWEGPIPTFN